MKRINTLTKVILYTGTETQRTINNTNPRTLYFSLEISHISYRAKFHSNLIPRKCSSVNEVSVGDTKIILAKSISKSLRVRTLARQRCKEAILAIETTWKSKSSSEYSRILES